MHNILLPFNVLCGEGLVLIVNKIFSIDREIKSEVRTNRIYTESVTLKISYIYSKKI